MDVVFVLYVILGIPVGCSCCNCDKQRTGMILSAEVENVVFPMLNL